MMESIHPAMVHFPIALLAGAFFFDILGLFLGRAEFHRLGLGNWVLGTVAAAAAVWSGWQAEAVAKHSYEIHQVMQLHKKLGLSVFGMAAFLLAWRFFTRDRLSVRARVFILAATLVTVGTLVYGAHLGGRLVYEFGVGGVQR